ncbi:GTP cyclohydrolase I FolE [Subsaximicrobium wynnwilliamsii]|uniref:GTP cyclohydrolase 1 n=1 Tax=Subsaximicrobium wynnwilliamsii TaxID=291179 RepID=A0A5C6ZND0_9FLAO|nr:GTP cyclohydrolase I FolE [Subsaximicrobium wynnwilliamsii]TXD84508.1 GTP cyclohydrolase I FolE [Subsaximicrobium wynnwilliamsii]TXD90190.1 GTP cyclohydrolase I FolE [Subsaximicrobium wynnwilliamsii]TXE04241.1 GTP cyclohydrolase I FolE [Subsaximicrobium wynnwilliamsii]
MKKELIEEIGDNHILTNIETPLLSNAFEKSDEEKIENIQRYFSKIMQELGLDLKDESLSGTPYRFAKMYVKELFYGLNPINKPKLSTFPNKYGYKKMLVEQDITIDSSCEHHFLPITGHAHIGYVPNEKVIGLSKINRLVDYYSHRPQVQERLCLQILNDLQETLNTKNVIVVLNAKHLCVSSRGIKDKDSSTTTIEFGGCFEDIENRNEFFLTLNKK